MLTSQEIDTGLDGLTPRGRFDYCPHTPTSCQQVALWLADREREVFYGGAAGGGKTDWLLMAALAYVHLPGNSLILRRTFSQLSKGDGLIERSKEWLGPTDAKWQGDTYSWRFPSGHMLEFGHIQHESDKYNYQGPAYQFVGWDELTSFTRSMYLYVSFSRQRRLRGHPVPLRTCATSNPGGKGHDWVDARFQCDADRWAGSASERGRVFVPAKLRDNPYIDAEEYAAGMRHLAPHERAQLLDGDWSARVVGDFFDESWFEMIDFSEVPAGGRTLRFWDKAGTAPHDANTDPDWTRGALGKLVDGVYYLIDVASCREEPAKVESYVRLTAQQDGYGVAQRWEEEPGASGKADSMHMRRLLAGVSGDLKGIRPTGPKAARAVPIANAAEAGDVRVVRASWNPALFDELGAFNTGLEHHDDIVDAMSGCYTELTGRWGFADLYPEATEQEAVGA